MGAAIATALPLLAQAQTWGDSVYSMHRTMENLFYEMLPLCSRLIAVGQALAGLGALLFIAVRVWGHIARAEPVDFYPLMRPFGILLVILSYTAFITMINSVLKPTVTATAAMAKDSQYAIRWYLQKQEDEVMTPPETAQEDDGSASQWAQYEKPETDDQNRSWLGRVSDFFSFKKRIKQALAEVLEVLYTAVGLAIDVIRTFYLVVLAIIGPIVLGLSVFDGFQHTFSHWLSRYVHVFMWLPVANLFGAISAKMLQLLMQGNNGAVNTTAYLIFLVISIIGYTTVPSVANYIMHPGGGGRDTLLHKVSSKIPFMKGR